MMKPRPHHYAFAYRALPRPLLTAQVGRTWMSLLAGPAGPLLLRRIWGEVGDALPPDDRLASDGFATMVHEITGGLVLVVLALPAAVVELEAHLVAVVAERDGWSPQRVLTLEKGSNALTGEPATYIAALRPGGSRVAFGEGPEPDAAAFAAAVCGHLGLTMDAARPPVHHD